MCLLLPACLSVPDGPKPECESNTDCDTAHGEVCEEGVCWGNPPPGSFAAIVTPPSERKSDLVSRELELVSIPPDGYLGDVALEQPVLYTGQIIAVCPAPVAQCDTTPLGATIVVTRPSFFAGGPGYRQVVTTDPRNGSFAIALPPTRPDDPAYTVTVVPDGRDPAPGTIDTGELVPPMQARLRVAEDQNGKSFQLGATALPTIEGKI
ncbi:MAG: hypothetical protein ABI867_23440, partial [Kofleriaceae bacterium]